MSLLEKLAAALFTALLLFLFSLVRQLPYSTCVRGEEEDKGEVDLIQLWQLSTKDGERDTILQSHTSTLLPPTPASLSVFLSSPLKCRERPSVRSHPEDLIKDPISA